MKKSKHWKRKSTKKVKKLSKTQKFVTFVNKFAQIIRKVKQRNRILCFKSKKRLTNKNETVKQIS